MNEDVRISQAFSDGIQWAFEVLKKDAINVFWDGNSEDAAAMKCAACTVNQYRAHAEKVYTTFAGSMKELAHTVDIPF